MVRRANQDEINEKISKSLTKEKVAKECPECKTLFIPRKKTSTYCCRICRSKNSMKNISQETRDRLKENALNRHAKKDGIGFTVRTKFSSSYPEKMTEQFLTKHKIEFVREKKIGKWFADFTIGNLVLEIDGQQHNLPERKLKDLEKDKDLMNQGFSVVRIEWSSDHSAFFEKLELFKEHYGM